MQQPDSVPDQTDATDHPKEMPVSRPEPLRWNVERCVSYPLITDLALSPDGSRFAYDVREPLLTNDRSEFLTHLYLVAVNGGNPIQLTTGESRNSSPQWSPDGRYLAFLSNRNGRSNIYVLALAGGESWPLTRYDKTNVTALRWSLSGDRLALVMAEPPTPEQEQARRAKNDPRRYNVDFDFAHLFVIPFAIVPRTLPVASQVTRGRFHVSGLAWLPDGRRLAITHRPNPGLHWPNETRLGLVPADGSAAQPFDLGRVAVPNAEPFPSPDGRWVACNANLKPEAATVDLRITTYATDGSGAVRPLAGTPDAWPLPTGWMGDGQQFQVLEIAGTTSQVWALPASGEAGRQLTVSTAVSSLPYVTNACANASGQVAFIGQTFAQPNALYFYDAAAERTHKVAAPSLPASWPDAPLPQAEVLRWQAPDDREVEGILVYPLGYEAGQRCPLIVQIHGGPALAFCQGYLGVEERHVDTAGLAERGYAILRPNPRGSTGYGPAFRSANHQDWGGGDYRDIIAGVDHLIARGIADPERLGIVGASFGGYMTSWTITQTGRFKAACVIDGSTNMVSHAGTKDFTGFVPFFFGGEVWDDPTLYLERSPVLQAKGVKTPTLILHGEQDVAVAPGQGYELYNALEGQSVPVELVTYPRQGHVIAEPRLQLDANRRIIEWFERWLGNGDSKPA